MKRILKELYGAGIIFFYYIKWPFAIYLPTAYFYLGFKDNIILDILWIWCIILIIKDFVYKFILKKSYCNSNSCKKEK